jgi:hypothetical protein
MRRRDLLSTFGIAAGAITLGSARARAAETRDQGGNPTAWNLTADYTEGCSCNMLCPCWYSAKELAVPTQGWCAGWALYRIRQGSAGGVDLSGLALAFGDYFPGPTIYDGNATARLYIDERANADQRRELEAIFQGRKGGPMALLAPLVTKWLPTQGAKIDVQEQGGTLTATIGGFGQIKSQRLTDDAGRPTTMQNAKFTTGLQFDNQAAQLAPSAGTRWSDPDMPRQFETKSGVVASLTWRVS